MEYGPDIRYTHPFGHGIYSEVNPRDSSPEAIMEEALKLGWSNGCPRVRHYIMESPHGADWMMRRYAEVNRLFNAILDLVRFHFKNDGVYNLLSIPKERRMDEPVGKHEPLSVPRSHLTVISPMSAIEGYSTPRILLELSESKTDALREALVRTGHEPWNFLAHLSEIAVTSGAEPARVLSHVYHQGVLEEENTRLSYVQLAQTLEQHAHIVWRIYENLPDGLKKEFEIADIPIV